MKIIVLSITQYKEKDGIILGISENGAKDYTVRGLFDPKNKNAGLNNPLTIADVELGSDRYKYPLIKNSSIFFTPLKVENDFYYLGAISFLVEITKKLLQVEEMGMMYKHLSDAIHALKKASDPWMILLIYIFNIFKATGYEFQADKCVYCGSRKNIVTFSFADGGFVCENCYEEGMEKPFNNEQMLLIRAAYFANSYEVNSEYCSKENAIYILMKCHEFIVDAFGYNINSISFLNQ